MMGEFSVDLNHGGGGTLSFNPTEKLNFAVTVEEISGAAMSEFYKTYTGHAAIYRTQVEREVQDRLMVAFVAHQTIFNDVDLNTDVSKTLEENGIDNRTASIFTTRDETGKKVLDPFIINYFKKIENGEEITKDEENKFHQKMKGLADSMAKPYDMDTSGYKGETRFFDKITGKKEEK